MASSYPLGNILFLDIETVPQQPITMLSRVTGKNYGIPSLFLF